MVIPREYLQDPCQLLLQQDESQHLDPENHQRRDQGGNECHKTDALRSLALDQIPDGRRARGTACGCRHGGICDGTRYLRGAVYADMELVMGCEAQTGGGKI